MSVSKNDENGPGEDAPSLRRLLDNVKPRYAIAMSETTSGLSPHEAALIAPITTAPMLAQVERWSAVNSGSDNLAGLAAVADMLAQAFAALPGTITRHQPAPVEAMQSDGQLIRKSFGDHVVITVRPDAPVRLLFTGHMDTVFGATHPFQGLRWLPDNPGHGRILNGPGVADMKGGIAVMLHALMALEQADLNVHWGYDVLLNSDEEVGSLSSAPLIAQLAQGKVAALTFEPAARPDGTLAGERGGSGNFSIHLTGRAAHAGRNPDDGRNALVAAADLAVRLKGLHRPGLSVNPAKIDGGGPNNVVPDHAILRVNFRPASPADAADADRALRALCDDIARAHDVGCHVHGLFNRPPKPLDDKARALFSMVKQAGADLGLTIDWISSGGVCDGNNIAACGVPVVDTMGVRGGAIHSSDEYLIVDSLAERAQLAALVIARIIAKGTV